MINLKKSFIFCLPVFLLPVLILLGSFMVAKKTDENAVKAMFIYNFSKYFDWTQIDANSDFVIAVHGNTEVTKYLEEITKTKSVRGKSIIIKTITSARELSNVQMLFVAGDDSKFIQAVNKSEHSESLIIITEKPGNSKSISHINLIHIQDKIGFELNETRLRDKNIKFSKELSGLAFKFY